MATKLSKNTGSPNVSLASLIVILHGACQLIEYSYLIVNIKFYKLSVSVSKSEILTAVPSEVVQ